jgi:PadR family transcriptional regulator PadR
MKATNALLSVAEALLSRPGEERWGYELGKQAGIRSGVLYPILNRMLADGLLEDGWEKESIATAESRPPRRYYRVTESGIAELGGLIARSRSVRSTRADRPRLA